MHVSIFPAPQAVVIHTYLHRWQHCVRYYAISRLNIRCLDVYRKMFQIMVENDFFTFSGYPKRIDFKIMRLKVHNKL